MLQILFKDDVVALTLSLGLVFGLVLSWGDLLFASLSLGTIEAQTAGIWFGRYQLSFSILHSSLTTL